MSNLTNVIDQARERLLRLHIDTKTGHVGGNLSSLEAIITLFHEVFKEEDRFILSKGHAAGALYIGLWSLGLLTEMHLETFVKDGTLFAGHPHPSEKLYAINEKIQQFIPFASGSLGHGVSLSCGLAYAVKLREKDSRIWCLCGDGEWQEGSCWEALIFATHHKLDTLTVLVDQNKLQGFGTVDEVASINDFASRFSAFGAEVTEVDGHNFQQISTALKKKVKDKPHVVLLQTIKGRGLSTENCVSSHYLPIKEYEHSK